MSLTLALSICSAVAAHGCPVLPSIKKSALVEYVRKEYKLKEDTDFQLIKDQPIDSSCYRELEFQGKNPIKTWQITMYLSPDGRFLSGELFDTTIDPIEEERRKAEILMTGLVANKGSSQGPDSAPVTIVEFSDFECPFCKRFADLLQQVPATERNQIRVVFHHLPLSVHAWARTAAEGAACAQLQSADAFWAVHDQIFQHQQEITPDNVKQKLREYAQNAKSLDMKLFQNCLDNEMSLGLVFRDMNLASANNVEGTPTLFVNGHRIAGLKDVKQFEQLIETAQKEPIQTHVSDSGAVSREADAKRP